MTVVGILLAAGAATRFGGGKLLQPLADGTPLGVAAARNLAAAVSRTIAVVRPGDDELAALLRPVVGAVVVCELAPLGMGHSIACAVAATRDGGGWIVALADMPLIRPASIRLVAQCLDDGAAIVTPFHAGQRGHPVGFSQRFGKQLEALSGDSGGRDLIRAHADEVVRLDCDDPGILADVDTREALASLRSRGT
jgi:molybdenum cofactor cytidylyltransferase